MSKKHTKKEVEALLKGYSHKRTKQEIINAIRQAAIKMRELLSLPDGDAK